MILFNCINNLINLLRIPDPVRDDNVDDLSIVMSTDCPSLSMGVPKGVQRCPKPLSVHKWTQILADWIAYIGVRRAVRACACLLGLLICFCMTLCHVQEEWQIGAYMAFIGGVIIMEPWGIVSKILSPQSRILVSLDIWIGCAAVFLRDDSVMTVSLIWILVTMSMVFMLNRRWMAQHLFLATSKVESGYLATEDTSAGAAWAQHGQRETRTMLHEMGLSVDETDLPIRLRACYILGFATGNKKNRQYEAQLKDQCQQLQKDYDDTRILYAKAIEDYQELQHIQSVTERMYETVLEENKRLRQANEELLHSIPDPVEMVAMEQEDATIQEERAVAFLKAGKSIREVVDLTGLKKWRVSEIRKKVI